VDVDVVVIGAGQAGLSASYFLRHYGVEHVVLDGAPGPGGAWQHRWPSLRLGKVHGIHDLPDMPLGRPDQSVVYHSPNWLRANLPFPEDATNIVFDDTMLTGSGYKSTSKTPLRQRRAPDSSTIYFTSGTTGTPKPVVLTHQAWEQRVLFANNSTFAGYERALIVPALFSAYGLNRAYEILHAGKGATFGLGRLTLE